MFIRRTIIGLVLVLLCLLSLLAACSDQPTADNNTPASQATTLPPATVNPSIAPATFTSSPTLSQAVTTSGIPLTATPAIATQPTLKLRYSTPALPGHTEVVKSVAFSPDGKTLASGSDDRTIKLWEVASGKELNTLMTYVSSVAFSPDGKILASSGGNFDYTIKLWEVAAGKELNTLKGHTNYITKLAYNPDGKILASSSTDKTIKLWEVSTGRELNTYDGNFSNLESLTFSLDGKDSHNFDLSTS